MVKNPPASAGDVGLIPGSGRSPGEGNANPLQYSCLGNPMDRGAWRAITHGVIKSRTWLSMQQQHQASRRPRLAFNQCLIFPFVFKCHQLHPSPNMSHPLGSPQVLSCWWDVASETRCWMEGLWASGFKSRQCNFSTSSKTTPLYQTQIMWISYQQPWPIPCFYKWFYQNPAKIIHSCVSRGCSYAMMAKSSSCNRDQVGP